jgi:hypothetical protein
MIEWIVAHLDELFAAIGAAVALATIIVKLTPSQSDDALLARVVAVLNYLSIVNPKAPK